MTERWMYPAGLATTMDDMRNDTFTSRPGVKATRGSLLLVTCSVLLFSACASPPAVPKADWLTDSVGWEVRDVDASEAPRWVLYERDASVANVKELRIVGVVDAQPEAVARELRHRLLDDTTLPKGVKRTLLRQSQTEVEYYGFNAMPFPFEDREVYERLRFTHDAGTGVHTVNVRNFEPGDPAKPGVLRIPVVQNTFVVAPAGAGKSVVTMDTVHDLGGHFPNWAIYGPVSNHLVNELAALNKLTVKRPRSPEPSDP